MKFGLELFGVSPRNLPAAAALAESVGFDSVWLPEHLIFPARSVLDGTSRPEHQLSSDIPAYDSLMLLATIACSTEHILLGTGIYILPLRNPINSARSIITLDRISGGRVRLGVGVGWLEDEYQITGVSWPERGKRLDEAIEVMRKLWSAEARIEHHGPLFSFPPVTFQPKPVNGQIPILVGGASPRALRRAALLGDGWLARAAHRDAPAKADRLVSDGGRLAQHIQTIEEIRRDAGRTGPYEFCAGLGPGLEAARICQDVGATRYMAGPGPAFGRSKQLFDWIRRYSDTVISHV